jgi:hypothetical protein
MYRNPTIASIELSETFQKVDDDVLTAADREEADRLLQDQQLQRSDPEAWGCVMAKRDAEAIARAKMKADMERSQAQQVHAQLSAQQTAGVKRMAAALSGRATAAPPATAPAFPHASATSIAPQAMKAFKDATTKRTKTLL